MKNIKLRVLVVVLFWSSMSVGMQSVEMPASALLQPKKLVGTQQRLPVINFTDPNLFAENPYPPVLRAFDSIVARAHVSKRRLSDRLVKRIELGQDLGDAVPCFYCQNGCVHVCLELPQSPNITKVLDDIGYKALSASHCYPVLGAAEEDLQQYYLEVVDRFKGVVFVWKKFEQLA